MRRAKDMGDEETQAENILVVDDNPQNLRLLVGILNEKGYKVRPAPNGKLALNSVVSLLPDLILLDINMPGMDGYEVCRRLKSDEKSRHIPVIFISAMNEVVDKVKAFAVGGVDYITKPFNVEEVLARIQTHLALQGMQRHLEIQNRRLQAEIEERRKAEEKVRILAMFPNENPHPILRVTPEGEILYANRAASGLRSLCRYEEGGRCPDSWTPVIDESLTSGEYRNMDDRLGDRVFRFMFVPIPATASVYIYGMDITERKRYEEHLLMTASVFDNIDEGILLTDSDGQIEKVNPGFSAITGYQAEEVIGQKPSILKSGRHEAEFYENMWQQLIEKGQWQGEIWNRRKNGEAFPVWMSITAIKDSGGGSRNYVGIFRDITSEKESEEALRYQAYHDPLTGLPNRQLFNDRLMRALAYAHRNSRKLAVFFMDLDKFKVINDTLGHRIGDLLLQEVAARLRECIREEDTVARLGGDEFTLILHDITAGKDSAKEIALRIIGMLSEPFLLEGREVRTSTSIGVTIYPEDGETAQTLIQNADTAMYCVKKGGRGRYLFYRPDLEKTG